MSCGLNCSAQAVSVQHFKNDQIHRSPEGTTAVLTMAWEVASAFAGNRIGGAANPIRHCRGHEILAAKTLGSSENSLPRLKKPRGFQIGERSDDVCRY